MLGVRMKMPSQIQSAKEKAHDLHIFMYTIQLLKIRSSIKTAHLLNIILLTFDRKTQANASQV
jgi:hypothetical protein